MHIIAIEIINENFDDKIFDDAILIVDKQCIENAETACVDRRFLVYDNDPESALIEFCSEVNFDSEG